MTSLQEAEEEDSKAELHLPAKIEWEMLDKSKFFVLGAALFSGVSAALYPIVVVKTRQQVSHSQISSFQTAFRIVSTEGFRGLYRGLGTSLMGTIPARALYMAALEVTKTNLETASLRLGFSEPTSSAIANAGAGVSSAMAAQLVWTPVDVISQRLMVQGPNQNKYLNGFDAFKKILMADGVRGLYRGFGVSILTYAPSNAVWWAAYSASTRLVWGGLGFQFQSGLYRPDWKTVIGVQGLSASMAAGASALITMPLDTVKTRLQVLENDENGGRRGGPTLGQTMRSLVREGGWTACYRGLGPRWACMSVSATTMITTYEFLKRLSAKNEQLVVTR